MQDIIESGKLGTLIEIESHYDYFKTRPVVTQDMIFNLGIHTIDQMIALFGIPDRTDYDVKAFLIKKMEPMIILILNFITVSLRSQLKRACL